MRKLLTASTIAALTLTLTACGNNDPEPATISPSERSALSAVNEASNREIVFGSAQQQVDKLRAEGIDIPSVSDYEGTAMGSICPRVKGHTSMDDITKMLAKSWKWEANKDAEYTAQMMVNNYCQAEFMGNK